MPSVNSEIRVGRQDHRIGQDFTHANEAGIGESHRHVGVLLRNYVAVSPT
jgi:hypothetical protein